MMYAMQRKLLLSARQQWHPRYFHSLPQTHHVLSLALNGYSGQQLKTAKVALELGNPTSSNLTFDESLHLLDEVARKFDPQLLCKAAIFSDIETRFPISVSASIVTSIKKSGTKEDLKNFRSLLCNDTYSSKFEFDPKIIQAVIDQCVTWDTADEALQWLMFAQDRLNIVPTNHSFNVLLSASSTTRSWDVLFYLIAEMDRNDIFVSTALREELIDKASFAPFARWRYTRDSLLKSGAVRVSNRPINRTQSPTRPTKQQHHLNPRSLATALWTLARAGELGALRELYRSLGADLLQWKLANDIAPSAPASTLPLFHGDAMVPLGFAATELQDHALLHQVLSNNFQEALSAPLPAVLAQKCSSKEEFSQWLDTYVTLLLGAQPLQMEAGRQIGTAISWHLSNNQPDLAAQVWNSHVSALTEHAQRSLDDESDRVRAATDATVAVISRTCAQSQSGVLLPATARFLRSVLVPGGVEQAVGAVPVPVEVSAASIGMVQDLLDVFARAQDSESAALVLATALKQGLLVSEEAMTTSLQLLQKQGDHSLVLELFELYLDVAGLQWTGPKVAPGGDNSASKYMSKNKTFYTTSSTFAPHIFTVAVGSFASLSNADGILHLLNKELPKRGFVPRKALVGQAMQALLAQGAFGEALGVFKYSQKLYGDLAKRSARGLRSVPAGYGVAQLSLVDIALRCCSRGKLGLDALEIFSSLEDAQGKGVVNVKAGEFAPLVESVIEALATPEYVKFIPQFLQSLGGLNAAIVARPEALLLSLAAAVSVADKEVVQEVARVMREDHGLISKGVDAQALLALLRERFAHHDEQAALALLAECNVAVAK